MTGIRKKKPNRRNRRAPRPVVQLLVRIDPALHESVKAAAESELLPICRWAERAFERSICAVGAADSQVRAKAVQKKLALLEERERQAERQVRAQLSELQRVECELRLMDLRIRASHEPNIIRSINHALRWMDELNTKEERDRGRQELRRLLDQLSSRKWHEFVASPGGDV